MPTTPGGYGRKRRVVASLEAIVALVDERGIATENEVCTALDVERQQARRKLATLTERGALISSDHDAEGRRVAPPEWRYGIAGR